MLTTTSSALEILEYHKSITWPIIDASLTNPTFPKHFGIPEEFQSEVKYYWEIAREYPLRKGKYVRPTVLALAALSMGAKESDYKNVAAAMQLSEDWILIQDDWEDDSPERRGKPTLHLMYPEKLAINATSGMQTIMWNLLAKASSSNSVRQKKIMDEFYLMLTRTVIGQHVDIDYVEKNITDYSDQDWYFIADSKTSYYTVAGPLRLGAIVSGATESQLEILTRFGLNLGRCFQLVDDLLDITTDFGGRKQLGNDIYESKRTLILGHLIRSAHPNDKKRIISIISKSRKMKTEKDITFITTMMTTYGSIEYAQKLAKEYKEKANEILESEMDFIKVEPYRSNLKTLMTFILDRKH